MVYTIRPYEISQMGESIADRIMHFDLSVGCAVQFVDTEYLGLDKVHSLRHRFALSPYIPGACQ